MTKLIYSIFLGLILVMFVGVGVATFYPAPDAPEYIESIARTVDEEDETIDETENQKQTRLKNEVAWETFNEQEDDYNRNVAIITMALALFFLYFSINKAEKFKGISEGILLGGVFTLFYSLIRGLLSSDDIVRFLVIAVGLAIALWIGNKRFGQTQSAED